MSKILVKASPQIQIGPDGKPQMYYNVGLGGRRGGGDRARGRTKRSRALGAVGTLAGLAGGLAGESRSLGGFLSNLQVGAMQGGAAGRGLANLATSRGRQARADILEGEKQARVRSDAKARLAGEREMERRRGLDFDPNMSLQEMRDMGPTPRRRRVLPGIGGKNMTQFGYELAAHREEQEVAAAEQAKQEKLRARGRRRDDDPAVQAVQNIDPERLRPALDLLTGLGIQGPQQQLSQVPQQIAPLSQETQNQITQGDQMPNPDDAFVDHDNDGGSAGQIAEGEMPESGDEEQQEQRVPSRLQRRFETDEEEQRGFDTFMGGGQ